MACTVCSCDASITNTGHGCTPIQEVTALLVAVPTFDSLGNRNSVPLNSTLNQTFFNNKVNETDASKRWRPLPKIKNVADVRDEATFFSFDDQTVEFIHEGARKFTALVTNESGTGATAPQMKGIIESIRCVDTSFYIITTGNQLIGQISEDGLSLEPIEIDEQSILAGFMKKTNEAPQHIVLQFNWSISAKDENLRMFDCAELGSADLLRLRGLVDICAELVDSTQTSLKVKLKTSFGTVLNPGVITGLTAPDFVSSDTGATSKIFNESDVADISITGVTESPKGTYELTFVSQTVGDVLVLKAVKTGFDFTCVTENPFEVES